MRILYVWPIVRMSVWDVARGYRTAIAKLVGECNIKDYYLDRHAEYHRKALPEEVAKDQYVLSQYATEAVLNEALYFNADLVFIVCGLNFHPLVLKNLKRVGMPTAVLFTESPYEDDQQREWARAYPEMLIFTNDRSSAVKYGWRYIPHSYDPSFHHPKHVDFDCDVILIGTGWKNRQKLLEAVDWTGINLKLLGVWPYLTEESSLHGFHQLNLVDNRMIAPVYSAAKICLNIHREETDLKAYSLGPRVFEIAGCRAFQLSDYRPELIELFGSSVPIFVGSNDLEKLIRFYLKSPELRSFLAEESWNKVKDCTFDNRAKGIVQEFGSYVGFSAFQEIAVNG